VEVRGVVCWAIQWSGTGRALVPGVLYMPCRWVGVFTTSHSLHQGCSGCGWRVLWICVEVCIQHVG